MINEPRIYSPKDGLLTISAIPISGYGTGTYINLTFPNNLYNDTEGADGEIARTEVANGLKAELTINIIDTARTNDLLWALMFASKAAKSTYPILFKDLNGTTTWECTYSWNKKAPDFAKDKDGATNRVWVFTLAEVLGIIGGN